MTNKVILYCIVLNNYHNQDFYKLTMRTEQDNTVHQEYLAMDVNAATVKVVGVGVETTQSTTRGHVGGI